MVHSRLYSAILQDHFRQHRQMALVSGPRQVGKTTVCRELGSVYLNWDSSDDRRLILSGPNRIAEKARLDRLNETRPLIVFDELHKYAKWKALLKGMFDVYGERCQIAVTGSAKIEILRRGSDSLMGRYFRYRMHPFSVAECLHTDVSDELLRAPQAIAEDDWSALWTHGGFPEPFLKRDPRFTRRWQTLRTEQLTQGDLRELTVLQNLGAMETLTLLLQERSGQQLVYSSLARDIGVAVDTVRHWIDLLQRLHFGFLLRPYFNNVRKALRKEPKWFLRDWSQVSDTGAKAETFIACHLLKAVEGWTDLGLGQFELRYVRDKLQREVDFLIVRDRKPWCLVEAKSSDTHLSDSLPYFQRETGAKHALQVVLDLPFVAKSCFEQTEPIIVPARTFLSQLV